MKKFELTTLKELEVNDRFYFANDKQKKVAKVVQQESKKTYVMKVGDRSSYPLNSNVSVVFLRKGDEK